MIIDYDTDGADETYDIPQKSKKVLTTPVVASACFSDRAISAASGIDWTELWQRTGDNINIQSRRQEHAFHVDQSISSVCLLDLCRFCRGA
jgi:hypothetical protein